MNIFKELTDKSWATPGIIGEVKDPSIGTGPAARTMLWFLLGVLSSMFLLFVVGYRMRMALPDWVPISDPGILWFNTALLVLSSAFMQLARNAAKSGHIGGVRNYMTLAGVLAIGFLAGQYIAWGQLIGAGIYAANSPAAAFFYLLTALHALHLAVGLIVLAFACVRAWQKIEVARIQLSVELCTTYWHYLLLVWLVFFVLLIAT